MKLLYITALAGCSQKVGHIKIGINGSVFWQYLKLGTIIFTCESLVGKFNSFSQFLFCLVITPLSIVLLKHKVKKKQAETFTEESQFGQQGHHPEYSHNGLLRWTEEERLQGLSQEANHQLVDVCEFYDLNKQSEQP